MLGGRQSAPAPKPAPSGADPRLGLRRLADFERIDPDRLSDVLRLYSAEIAHFEIEPPFYQNISALGQTNRAGRRRLHGRALEVTRSGLR